MKRTGRKIAVLLMCALLLGGCGWLDQLWIMAKAGRALSTMTSLTAEIEVEAEGKAGNLYLWLPYTVTGQGRLQWQKEPTSLNLDLNWQGGSGLLQIPLHTQIQRRLRNDQWQCYEEKQKQWVYDVPPEKKSMEQEALRTLLKAGQWSMNETIRGLRCAEVSVKLEAEKAVDLLQSWGVQEPILSLIKSQDELAVCLAVNYESGEPVRLMLDSEAVWQPDDKLSLTLAQLHVQADFSLINETEWLSPE